MILTRVIDSADAGKTVLSVLKNNFCLSTKLLRRLKVKNLIAVNGRSVYTNYILSENDVLTVTIEQTSVSSQNVLPESIPLDVLYEDDCFIAINKPHNMIVHPTNNHLTGTLANALAYKYLSTRCSGESQDVCEDGVHPVSRLDRDTTGVALFAKNSHIAHLFHEMHKKHSIEKEYVGIVTGIFVPPSGEINLPIERAEGSIMLRRTSVSGKPALTLFKTADVNESASASLVLFYPVTGRTHQIRLHAKELGHPLLSDDLYGNEKRAEIISRHALHSLSMKFSHPLTLEPITICAPLPDDMIVATQKLGLNLDAIPRY